jgi:hypothetical protein
MGVILEIRAGAWAGKVIPLKTGESVTVGRATGKAKFALAEDTFMSGLHFGVECGPQGCRVQDRKSSNGTFLNGAKIQEAMLANGDEIKAGQTVFIVKMVPDAKIASLLPPEEAPSPPAAQQRPRPSEPPLRAEAPPPPAMRAADLERQVAQSRPAAVEPPVPPPVSLRPGVEDSGNSVQPPTEEPPGFRGVPNPPRAAEDAAGADAKPPRGSELPPGVAPLIAQKFGDHPASRSGMTPRGAAFSVMGWSFPAAPAEWQVQEGFGLQQSGHEDFPSSVAATEELLGGITLQQYVESQISTLRGYLRDPRIEPTMPPRVGGADESLAVDVRHSTKDGRELVYRRIYARSGASVGVLTVTTLASDFSQVLQTLQPLLDGAAFRATVSN